ncbi:hypothetical protein ACGE24_02395 [Corynebacterium kroppenstedtii]
MHRDSVVNPEAGIFYMKIRIARTCGEVCPGDAENSTLTDNVLHRYG